MMKWLTDRKGEMLSQKESPFTIIISKLTREGKARAAHFKTEGRLRPVPPILTHQLFFLYFRPLPGRFRTTYLPFLKFRRDAAVENQERGKSNVYLLQIWNRNASVMAVCLEKSQFYNKMKNFRFVYFCVCKGDVVNHILPSFGRSKNMDIHVALNSDWLFFL